MDPNAVPAAGVSMLFNERIKRAAFATFVQNAFGLIHIKTQEQIAPNIPDNELQIVAGRRR